MTTASTEGDISRLDQKFRKWLQELADKNLMSIENLIYKLAEDEIVNRETWYPKIKKSLTSKPVDYELFKKAVEESWSMQSMASRIRFNYFKKHQSAITTIESLIDNFPENYSSGVNKINGFIDSVVKIGFSDQNGKEDRSGASLFASVILTSVYPTKFVDFTKKRWISFSRLFERDLQVNGADYGSLVLSAGKLAIELANTETFQQYWAGTPYPLWVLSGLCWVANHIKDVDYAQEWDFDNDYKHGLTQEEKTRLAKIRKRDTAVAKKLKELYGDKCQVTGTKYTFRKNGDGQYYSEAHHLIPLGEGGADQPHNIVILSPLIHRMFHYAKVEPKPLDLTKIKDNKLSVKINEIDYEIIWDPSHAEIVRKANMRDSDEN